MKYTTGAIIDKTRITKEPTTFGANLLPANLITDISMLRRLNQLQQEACVGHAGAGGVDYDYYKKCGKLPDSSPRWNYGVAKIVDGDLSAGTSATSMFKGWNMYTGSATELTVPNNASQTVALYTKLIVTAPMLTDAAKYPIKNEVDIANPTSHDLMNLIAQYGVALIAVEVDEETWMRQDGTVSLKPGNAGGHEILLYGYETVGNDIRFHILNSWGPTWGTNGCGSFMWSDYNGYVYDAMSIQIDKPGTSMPTVTLTRGKADTKETPGTLVFGNFSCLTLERPWLNNQPNISCIPPGTYTCQWCYMNDLKAYHYQIMNVPGRTEIFIHNGNFYTNVLGCVEVGNSKGDINGDGEQDVLNSVATLSKFEALGNKQPFTIIIK